MQLSTVGAGFPNMFAIPRAEIGSVFQWSSMLQMVDKIVVILLGFPMVWTVGKLNFGIAWSIFHINKNYFLFIKYQSWKKTSYAID